MGKIPSPLFIYVYYWDYTRKGNSPGRFKCVSKWLCSVLLKDGSSLRVLKGCAGRWLTAHLAGLCAEAPGSGALQPRQGPGEGSGEALGYPRRGCRGAPGGWPVPARAPAPPQPARGRRGAPGQPEGKNRLPNTLITPSRKVTSGKGLDPVLCPSAGSGKLQSSGKTKPRCLVNACLSSLGPGGQICCPTPAHMLARSWACHQLGRTVLAQSPRA